MSRAPRLAVLGWAVVILVGTSIPGSDLPRAFPHADKLVHLSMYAVLGYLTGRAAIDGRRAARRARSVAALAAIAVFAAFDEWHQDFVPQRSSDPLDWLADIVGATAGLALVATITPRSEQQT